MVSAPGALGAETDNSGDSSADGPGPGASSRIAKERSMYIVISFVEC